MHNVICYMSIWKCIYVFCACIYLCICTVTWRSKWRVLFCSVASKLLEHIIHSHIMKYIQQHNSLTDSQHGFRAKKSTETQLIQTIHDISRLLDMAILDFTKAFDKVPDKLLIHKLNYYGISGSLATWIETVFIWRTQQVIVNWVTSYTIVTSGVPQGTVLGPLLFLLYMNDLPDKLRLFADDCILYSIGHRSQYNPMQTWQDTCFVKFNPGKCYSDLERQRIKQRSENETSTLAGVDSSHLWRRRLNSEKADEKRLESPEMWIYRRMLRVSWTEHRADEIILLELNTTRQVLGFVVRRKLSYFGYTIRDGGCELVKCVIQGKWAGSERVEDQRRHTVATSRNGCLKESEIFIRSYSRPRRPLLGP